jgi:hypothetical protein
MIPDKFLRCEEYGGFCGEEWGVVVGFAGEVAKGEDFAVHGEWSDAGHPTNRNDGGGRTGELILVLKYFLVWFE